MPRRKRLTEPGTDALAGVVIPVPDRAETERWLRALFGDESSEHAGALLALGLHDAIVAQRAWVAGFAAGAERVKEILNGRSG